MSAGICGNITYRNRVVGQFGGNNKLALTTGIHTQYTFFPAIDDLTVT